MGKYDKVIVGLPKLSWASGSPHENIEYWEKVQLVKGEFKGGSAVLTKTYFKLRHERDAADEKVKALNLRLTALVGRIEELYEAEGIKNMTLLEGTLRLDPKPHAVVEKPEEFHQWCLDNGYAPQMNLAWQTTNSLVKERLLSGEPDPPGIKVFVKTTPAFTKPK